MTTKHTILIGLLFVVALSTVSAIFYKQVYPKSEGEILLRGRYSGENIFIYNPLANEGFGFCAYEVNVNKQIITDEINTDTIEIHFQKLGIKQPNLVEILIKHKEGCTPIILNPEALIENDEPLVIN